MTIVRKQDATWVIPSENEWYKAAYHKNDGVTGNYYLYPTINDTAPSNDLVDPDPGNNANYHESDHTIGSPYWRTEVGEFENSEGPYGAFDQGGNVAEWNEARYSGLYRDFRGGSFSGAGGVHASHNSVGEPALELDYLGFRVAEVPEPSAIAMLALAGIGSIRANKPSRSS